MEDNKILDALADRLAYCTKGVSTADEVSRYTRISKSYLYKLTMNREIPHYKPTGKLVFFNRREVEKGLQNNRIKPESELNREAQSYCRKNK